MYKVSRGLARDISVTDLELSFRPNVSGAHDTRDLESDTETIPESAKRYSSFNFKRTPTLAEYRFGGRRMLSEGLLAEKLDLENC